MNLVSPDHPALRAVAAEVTNIAEQVAPHVDAMRKLMIAHNGIGLAAPQVGLSLRFFVFGNRGTVVINPAIVAASDQRDGEEGCLSFPGARAVKTRAHRLDVRYTDESGAIVEKRLNGLYAVAFQHETDHLNGICISP